MPSQLKNELAAVASVIDELLENDDYPNIVQPEYLREAVRAYPCQGGKRLRPALLIWSCGLFGGNVEQAYNAAAAVEIYHNWTLVHDDIIDNDKVRRGAPTSHCFLRDEGAGRFGLKRDEAEKFGRDFAILAGDIQQGWAVNMLLKSIQTGVDPRHAIASRRRAA